MSRLRIARARYTVLLAKRVADTTKRVADTAESWLRRAYDHLVDVEAVNRPALGAYLSPSAARTERHRSAL